MPIDPNSTFDGFLPVSVSDSQADAEDQNSQRSILPRGAFTGLGQSAYDFNYRVFPDDLGSDYNSHYMVININVPTNLFTGDVRSSFTSRTTTEGLSPTDISSVDRLRYQEYSIPGTVPGTRASDIQRESFSVPRFTRRITESIALFMPSSLIHTNQNLYEEVSLTALGGKVFSVAANLLTSGGGGLAGQAVNRATGGAAGRILNSAGQVIGQTAALAKYPINPRVEVLFSTSPQRQFVFEVLMAPRSEKESYVIEEIIRTLRFHAAPEIGTSGLNLNFGASDSSFLNGLGSALTGAANFAAGLTFIPPAEFDISFYHRGRENTRIPRINTCVLEKIEVDYSPTGGVFSTFRNGHPVAVRLSMAFREVEIPHKLRILQGF